MTNNPPIVGYSDKISVRQGETIEFKVSSYLKTPFTASLKRSISADPNPKGIGIIEKDASKYFKKSSFKSREQKFNPGSYGVCKKTLKIEFNRELLIKVIIYPTFLNNNKQTILAHDGLEVYLNSDGKVTLSINKELISIKENLSLKKWYEIQAKIYSNGKIFLSYKSIKEKNSKIFSNKAKFKKKIFLRENYQ